MKMLFRKILIVSCFQLIILNFQVKTLESAQSTGITGRSDVIPVSLQNKISVDLENSSFADALAIIEKKGGLCCG